ncbi:MAG: hypothetical protein HY334_07785 [Armatimonadetes bacterium]|nr:hypothetical protein [Armatimonadota bacterium]
MAVAWLPRPRLHFELELDRDATIVTLEETESATLRLTATGDEAPCLITEMSIRSPGPSRYTGTIQQIERRTADPLVCVRFHVVNFASRGTPIRDAEGGRRAGRNTLEGGGWRVVLDWLGSTAYRRRPEDDKAELPALEREGYEVTHVGSLERADGSPFTVEDCLPVIDLLSYLLSFARGRYCCLLLPVGFNADGRRAWEEWSVRKVHPGTPVEGGSWSWYLGQSRALGAMFPGMVSRWSDADWQQVLRLAIDLYVTANQQASTGASQVGLVVAQSALELLAWAVLVERRQVVSPEGFEKLAAADTLRLLLELAGVPREIPAALGALCSASPPGQKGGAWRDGPHAITDLRNGVVHPTRSRRLKLGVPDLPWLDAASLTLWYVELVLLRLLEYDDAYRSRLTFEKLEVPWAGGLRTPLA